VTEPAICITPEPQVASAELEAALLAACRRGDAASLRAFVVRHQDAVFAFLSRTLGAGPHVEDLAQDVFLRAFRALPRFDPHGPARLSTWLLAIASRLAVDYRQKRRIPTQSLDEGALVRASATPETERRRLEIGRALARAAAELSDEQRDVFVLAEFHGLQMQEIAEVLSVPEATVKTRLFRARERLRHLLKDVWDER